MHDKNNFQQSLARDFFSLKSDIPFSKIEIERFEFFFFNKNCKYFLIISKRINLFVCWVKILRGKQISLKNRISTRPHSIRFASEDIVVLSNVKLVREPTRWDSKPLTFITSILKLSKTTSLDFHSSPSLSLFLLFRFSRLYCFRVPWTRISPQPRNRGHWFPFSLEIIAPTGELIASRLLTLLRDIHLYTQVRSRIHRIDRVLTNRFLAYGKFLLFSFHFLSPIIVCKSNESVSTKATSVKEYCEILM